MQILPMGVRPTPMTTRTVVCAWSVYAVVLSNMPSQHKSYHLQQTHALMQNSQACNRWHMTERFNRSHILPA